MVEKDITYTEIRKSDFSEINSAIIHVDEAIKSLEKKIIKEAVKIKREDPRYNPQRALLMRIQNLQNECNDLQRSYFRILVDTYGSI